MIRSVVILILTLGSAMMLYAQTDKYETIELGMTENGGVRFILPAEGITPEEILSDPDCADVLTCDRIIGLPNVQDITVNLALPKFDVSCDNALNNSLKDLGLTDIFSPETADFSPLTDEKRLYVGLYSGYQKVSARMESHKAAYHHPLSVL